MSSIMGEWLRWIIGHSDGATVRPLVSPSVVGKESGAAHREKQIIIRLGGESL